LAVLKPLGRCVARNSTGRQPHCDDENGVVGGRLRQPPAESYSRADAREIVTEST
jgi:hypothetical protein